MVGAPVAAAGAGEGYIPLAQMIGQVIGPLKTAWGPEFGGVMGWEFQLDQGGTWAEGIWQGLAGRIPQRLLFTRILDPRNQQLRIWLQFNP